MRVQKKILQYIISVTMVMAIVLGLCADFTINYTRVQGADAFETSISGFPESYKPYLRTLHKQYPKWKFVPYNTGIKFSTAVKKEYEDNRSLIEKSFSKYLKSTAPADYSVSGGYYIPKDGSSWVTASKNAIAYFMDPRNFLNEKHIYMFEKLSYDSTSQTQTGVEAILDNTFMHKTDIGYITTKAKYKSTDIKYSKQILEAAQKSKVSAYYIASKIIQEIGTKKHERYAGMGASGSINGEYSKKYTGIYNFYNIGAFSSANPIANGLKWASSDTSYGRPWNTPMKSINGGAAYIGEKYINCGQDTTYYQRFNVNKNSQYGLYQHQYMTNIYGAASEAAITSDAYLEMGITNLAKTFVIPVYKSMPSENAKVTIGNQSKSGYIISNVNLRKGPGTTYKTSMTLNKNDKVTVQKGVMTDMDFSTTWLSNPYWYQVKGTKNGKAFTGYVSAAYVNLYKEKDIAKGATIKLPVSVTSGHTVYYVSDNPAVASVDSSGNITGVNAGTTTIRAYTANGGMSSAAVEVNNLTAPKKPTIQANSKNYNSVKIQWSQEAGVTGYYLYKKNAEGKYKIIAKPAGTTYSYTDTKLTTGQPYSYKVKAYKTINGKKYKSPRSKAVSAKPVPGKPKKPLITNTGRGLTISWKSIKGASGYILYRSTSKNGTFKKKKILKGKTSVSFVDTKVTAGRIYYYKVVAYRKVSGKKIYGKESAKAHMKK